MYYLSCVDTVINHNQNAEEEDILTNYQHYYLLSEFEKNLLLDLVSLFNPLIFIDAGVFVVDPALVPDGMSNEFYKITDNRFSFHVDKQIMIGGQWVKVLKIMACKTTWLYKFYINPLNNFNKIDDERYIKYTPVPKPIYSPPPPQITYSTAPLIVSDTSSYHYRKKAKKADDDDCCLIF